MRRLTVYDFDKTIYDGETLSDFYKFYLKRKPVKIVYVFSQFFYLMLYLLKIIKLEILKEKFLNFLNGEPKEEIEKSIDQFWLKNKGKINSWLTDEVKKNKKETDYLIAISASPSFLIERELKKIDFDIVIATDFEFSHEKFKSKILSKNCKNIEKVRRLNEWAESENIKYNVVNFYSDSIADKPLYDLAENKFWINNGKINVGEPQKKTILDKLFWK